MMRARFILPLFIAFIFLNSISSQTTSIYVSDAGNFNQGPWQILKFDGNGENGEVFTTENLAWPQDIMFVENDSQVLISNLNTGVIARHNAEDGSYIGNFASGIGGPTRMKLGPDNLLYVLQWTGNGKVLRYNLDGTFLDEFTDSGVPQSIGLDWDDFGNLYVSSYNGGYVRKFDTNGVSQGNFVSGLAGPTNVKFRPNGDLLVLDYNAGNVKLYGPTGNSKGFFINGLSNPEGISVLSNGNIILGNGGTSSVKMYDSDGNFIKDLVSSGTLNLLIPNAVVVNVSRPVSAVNNALVEQIIYTNDNLNYYINTEYLSKVKSASIVDLSGRLISQTMAIEELVFSTSHFSAGVYLIQIEFNDGISGTKKIIVSQ